MCFAPLPNALRPLHPNLSQFEFSSFSTFFCWIFPIWWAKFRRGVLRDEFLLIFWIEHDHIFFPVISYAILLHSRFYPHIFLKIPQNRILPLFNIVVRSSSGWVLMVLKVLPSKSLKSGENFKYLQRTHISNSSWDIMHFLAKIPPFVSYVLMHHIHLSEVYNEAGTCLRVIFFQKIRRIS